jgi:AcrR family transcriptional regulator
MEVRKKEKKKTILKAAASVFSREGYEKTRMDDIASTAGVGKGTIYQYFNGKEQLFQEMIKDGFNVFTEKLRQEIQASDNDAKVFKKIIDFSFQFMEMNKDIAKLIIRIPITMDEQMVEWAYIKKNQIIQLLADLVKQHGSSEIDPLVAAHGFLGMIVSLVAENVFYKKSMN